MKRRIEIGGLLVALVLATTSASRAQPSTEEPASVIVFPKVIADGSRDTFVQITNTSNNLVNAVCFYVNAQLLLPEMPPGPANPRIWQQIDFSIVLTARQPTNWIVSRGRQPDPRDPLCDFFEEVYECYGTGLDPGRVPSVPDGFVGELICVEADASLDPISGNHLIGEATLTDLSSGDVAKYGGIGLEGFASNDGDGELVLGQEYAACPESWTLHHAPEGRELPAAGAGSALRTDLTIVPCSQDFDAQTPETAVVQFLIVNEFEQPFSSSTTITCWGDSSLNDINPVFAALGSPTAQTLIRPSSGSASGVLLVAEEFRSTAGPQVAIASAAGNAHADGTRVAGDVIRLP
jgi:hypothetical protein